MKVGTDAILLGSLVKAEHDRTILDVGTGCGVIALMLAQRFSQAHITGIDIDPNAIVDARQNFDDSSWKDRLTAQTITFQEYSQSSSFAFDHIVSNPPFFTGNQLSVFPSRTKSRHTVYLSHEDFMASSLALSHEKTRLTVVLPFQLAERFIQIAAVNDFKLISQVRIHPFREKPANRVVLGFSRKNALLHTESLYIYEPDGEYTDPFRELTRSFYL
jgi:tRNA1Val (adenine37-N6)-methyltransferase